MKTQKRGGRVSKKEKITQLNYLGTVHHSRKEEGVWLMAIGYFVDLRECHKKFVGTSKPKRKLFIDDVIPLWI